MEDAISQFRPHDVNDLLMVWLGDVKKIREIVFCYPGCERMIKVYAVGFDVKVFCVPETWRVEVSWIGMADWVMVVVIAS